MKKTLILILLILVLLVSGCSPAPTATAVQPSSTGQRSPTNTPVPDLLGREKLSSYTATFEISFDGPVKWNYKLVSRKSAAAHEANLHIEGIQGAQNPGDIRLVSDAMTTWMIGPGTDNECVQFPTNSGMNPNLVYPEALISMQDLPALASFVREEAVGGRESRYYRGGPLSIGQWKDAHVEYHQETATGALLQFAMLASGEDIFFGTGSGTLVANYTIDSFDEPTIEPITGCEIPVSLPESATMFVRLPGLASFESPSSVEDIRAYYQADLPGAGWAEVEPVAANEGVLQLSYARGSEKVEIQIEPNPSGGSKVQIFSFQQ